MSAVPASGSPGSAGRPPGEGAAPGGAKAAFIDRDGVINEDRGYVARIEDFVFLPGAIEGLKGLQDAGYLLVIITNQSGIARGYYTEGDYERLTQHMLAELARHGVHVAAVEHCPHLPDAPVVAYRQDCDCRKPKPGMILRAARRLGTDLSRSILIGDKDSDIEAGRAAGIERCCLTSTVSGQAAGRVSASWSCIDLRSCVRGLLDETERAT